MRVEVETIGLTEAARHWARVADRAEDLSPLGWRVRERWHESERRAFRARASRWAPRAASTLERYRYPVRRWRRGGRRGRGRGPMMRPRPGATRTPAAGVYTGALERGLTRPHQPGVRDSISVGRAGLTAVLGLRARGPLAHGHLFAIGAGSRPARPGVIVFDEQAQADAAADVLEHLDGLTVGSGRARIGGRR